MTKNIHTFYRRAREASEAIAEKFPLLVSLETEDGGKAGIMAEVTREEAGKRIAGGTHRLATEAEAAEVRAADALKRDQAHAADLAQKLRLEYVKQAVSDVSGLILATTPSAVAPPPAPAAVPPNPPDAETSASTEAPVKQPPAKK